MTGEKAHRLLMFQAALLLSTNLQAAQQVNMLSAPAADSAVQAAPRPILALFSIDWCRMKQKLNIMEYVIQLLEKKRKALEKTIREEELMLKDKKQANAYLRNISEIRRAIKVLKTKLKQRAAYHTRPE